MVSSYHAGVAVEATGQFVDLQGNQLVGISSAQYRVLDEAELELVAWTALPAPGPNEAFITVTVAAGINQLGAGVRRGFRAVEFEFVKDSNTYQSRFEYVVQGFERLVVGDNSFQTFAQAYLRGLDLGNIEHFLAATDDDKVRSLSDAYWTLSAVSYFVDGYSLPLLSSLNETQLNTLDVRFVEALGLAQLIEADEMLNPDSLHRKRMEGLMAETIGESSVFFRPEKVLITQRITRRTQSILRPWIDWAVPIGRA